MVHTVLYIEDNSSSVRLVERIFDSRPDLRLITATTGREGIDVARVQLPAVVLLDMHLPDNGGRVLKCLRNEPITAAIPVIVLSADAIDRHIQLALEQGAAAYVTKPYDGRLLLGVIDDVIRGPLSTAECCHG